ncbi:MAG: hypothetical protein KC800_34330, partial [Candidatus Eremiobacteraeota bacterium]|nr:hypothetical protein [Candidatus Eremiobacteraeota bacterium]
KFAKEVLGLVKTHFLKGTKDLLFKIRSVARRHYVGNPTMLSRELPGLLVYSQGSIKIGTSPRDSVLASGLFIAEKDLSFRTQRTIGTAISLEGDVTGNDFLYYPFFSSASLYNSVKFRNELEEMAPGLPSSKEPAQNFDLPGCRIIYQGWAK